MSKSHNFCQKLSFLNWTQFFRIQAQYIPKCDLSLGNSQKKYPENGIWSEICAKKASLVQISSVLQQKFKIPPKKVVSNQRSFSIHIRHWFRKQTEPIGSIGFEENVKHGVPCKNMNAIFVHDFDLRWPVAQNAIYRQSHKIRRSSIPPWTICLIMRRWTRPHVKFWKESLMSSAFGIVIATHAATWLERSPPSTVDILEAIGRHRHRT